MLCFFVSIHIGTKWGLAYFRLQMIFRKCIKPLHRGNEIEFASNWFDDTEQRWQEEIVFLENGVS